MTIVRGLGLRTGDVGIGDELGVLASGDSGMCPTDFLRWPELRNGLGSLWASPCKELGREDEYCVAGEFGQLEDGELLCDDMVPTSGGEWNMGGERCDFNVGDRGDIDGESPDDAER